MPALKLFGKKTMVAGDDLRTMATIIFLFRLAQFTLAVPVLISLVGGAAMDDWQDVVEYCEDKGELTWSEANSVLVMHLFISFSLTMSTTGMAVAIGIYIYSGRGTPTNAEPRKPIIYFCYLHLTVYHLLRALSFAFGVVSTEDLDEYCDCRRGYNLRFSDDPQQDSTSEDTIAIRDHCDNQGVWLTCYVALVVTHWMDVVYAVLSFIYFSRKYIPKTNQRVVTPDRTCRVCCRCCFVQLSCMTCCQYGGREAIVGDLTDFSLIMKNYMDTGGHLDVTPTDILAAIYTLKRVHVQEHLETKAKFMLEESVRQHKDLSSKLSAIVEASKELDDSSAMEEGPVAETPEQPPESSLPSNEDKEETLPVSAKLLSTLHEAQLDEEMEICFESVEPQSREKRTTSSRPSMTMNDLQTMDSFRHNRKSVVIGQQDGDWKSPQETVAFIPDNAHLRRRGGLNKRVSVIQTVHTETRETLDLDVDAELFVLAEAARFIHAAEAIYTWSLWPTKQARDLVGLTYLAKKLDERHPEVIEWINDVQAWLKVAPIPGVTPKDVIYASFRKSLTATPYCVLVDHAWKSVVITIRGSMSLEDMLTDLTMVPAELNEVGQRLGFEGGGRFCHRGILARVEWIYEDLKSKQILETIYGVKETNHPGHEYRLRVCGHSLGAGCAAILSLLLRPQYPSIRCIAYSPPGCSVSERLAREMESYVTSHIVDTDVVGRTTIGGITQLRDELLEVVARIRIPKYQVLGKRKGQYKRMSLQDFNEAALTPVEEIPPSKYYDEVKTFFEYQESRREETKELFENELFPPGKIVQFFRTVNLEVVKKNCFGTTGHSSVEDDTDTDQAYTARWAQKEDFSRVVLSSHFLSDHETANVKGQIHLLAQEAGLKEPYDSVLSLEP